jgi:hypothetical protein
VEGWLGIKIKNKNKETLQSGITEEAYLSLKNPKLIATLKSKIRKIIPHKASIIPKISNPTKCFWMGIIPSFSFMFC